jgi:cyclase
LVGRGTKAVGCQKVAQNTALAFAWPLLTALTSPLEKSTLNQGRVFQRVGIDAAGRFAARERETVGGSSLTARPAGGIFAPMPRRWFLLAVLAALGPMARSARAQINTVQTVAPGVYFHQGDPRLGTCNNGWIVMDAYVVEVDANYPVGANMVIPKIKALTDRPVKFVIDTHFHPDHASGNQVWVEAFGSMIVAHEATLEILRESGAQFWQEAAKARADVAASRLKLPDIVYSERMAFEDPGHRIELRWPGPAHTLGDTVVWLPREKILFTGDMCVNGSFNYVHDSILLKWIPALEALKSLGAVKVCPGHGPMGGPEVIADQEAYFVALRVGVRGLVDQGLTSEQAVAAGPGLAAELKKNRLIARYVPSDHWFALHVEKMYAEVTAAR